MDFFSGEKGTIKEAKSNLSKFKIVGLLEDLSGFKRDIDKCFNINLKIPFNNKNPTSTQERENIDPEIHKKKVEVCHKDTEIYE